MRLFDFLKTLTSKNAESRTAVKIDKLQDLTGVTGTKAVAEQHYIQLILSEMFLEKSGEWFTTRYPLVYSLIALRFGDQPQVEFADVSGKSQFEIKQTDLNRSILKNYPLTPLLPFRGGHVEIDLGLVSMRAGNILESFAKTVSEVAGTLKLAQLSSAADITAAVTGGIQSLLGAGESVTKLSAHDMMYGNPEDPTSIESGFIFLSAQKAGSVGPKEIWMTRDGLKKGANGDQLKALPSQDYMLLHVRVVEHRDDWISIGEIGKPLDKAIEAGLKGQDSEAKAFLVEARMAAVRHPGLTRGDAARVIVAMNRYFNDQAAILQTVEDSKQEAYSNSMSLHLQAAIAQLPSDADIPALENLEVL
ncbi:hypothetical protein ACCS69_33510 [Rhizobium johnstonii]|uniref:hypothetical protein n=1 Tax=Rhizobium johnstonii TaxID=3019933 RepID=UPI003F9DF33C